MLSSAQVILSFIHLCTGKLHWTQNLRSAIFFHLINTLLRRTSLYSSFYTSFYSYGRVVLLCKILESALRGETFSSNSGCWSKHHSSWEKIRLLCHWRDVSWDGEISFNRSVVLDRPSLQKHPSSRRQLTDEKLHNFPGKMYKKHTGNKKWYALSSVQQSELNKWCSSCSTQQEQTTARNWWKSRLQQASGKNFRFISLLTTQRLASYSATTARIKGLYDN